MIIGIGCDTANYDTAKKFGWESDEKQLNRMFTQRELDLYYENKGLKFLTGRFAAKEAVLKCLGSGMYDGISLKNIEILRLPSGQPIVELNGEVERISLERGIAQWFVSISHAPTESIAFVVAAT